MTPEATASETALKNLVMNPGFEEPVGGTDDPPAWIMGYAKPGEDHWFIDEAIYSEGERSLRLEPKVQCVATQVLDAPVAELAGKTVHLSVDIRTDDATTPPTVMVLALNPELAPDPLLQTGVAGKLQLAASRGRDGRFVTYTSKFVATAPAASLQVMLMASGAGGRVWFDNVSITIEP